MNEKDGSAEHTPRWDRVFWLVDEEVLLGGASYNVRFGFLGTPDTPPSQDRIEAVIRQVATTLQSEWSDITRYLGGESQWEWLAAIERISVTVNDQSWDAYLERDTDDGDEVKEHFASGKLAS